MKLSRKRTFSSFHILIKIHLSPLSPTPLPFLSPLSPLPLSLIPFLSPTLSLSFSTSSSPSPPHFLPPAPQVLGMLLHYKAYLTYIFITPSASISNPIHRPSYLQVYMTT